jgi:F-type H+-transporting ATPase subunit alpha
LKVVDILVPIGRGQQKFIIEDKQTRKTIIVIDTILIQNQINMQGTSTIKFFYYVYVAIGHIHSTMAQLVKIPLEAGVLKYHIIVATTTSDPLPLQFLAPYSSCVVA